MTRKKSYTDCDSGIIGEYGDLYFNKFNQFESKKVYYGQVSHKNDSIALYSEKDKHTAYLKKDIEQMKAGDWVKVTMTDQKGVILNVESIAENEVPNKVLTTIKG
ncbi:hypothetical protein L6Q64_13745 [Staphylococcus pseudintermedius]|nr:hypothetical protein L6Q64_13745 [Staphylococcus pseudintermedius]